jgi:hypothetical protein
MAKKQSMSAKIRKAIKANPKATNKEIAAKLGCTYALVYQVARAVAKQPKKIIITKSQVDIANKLGIDVVDYAKEVDKVNAPDMINNPPHYTTGGIEVIDFIEAKGLGYHLGNVIKYVTRAGMKGNKLEDLRKAQWYIDRAIDNLELS